MYQGAFTCAVGYDPDVPCVAMTWKGYATSTLFRETNERVLGCLWQHRADRLLGDVADFVLIAQADQDWLTHDWIPRAIDAGLRRCALVQPVYSFNRVAVDNVGRRIDPARLAVGYFAELDAARRWLAAPA